MVQISVMVPTRGRPFLLKRLLDSIAGTADDLSGVEVIIYMDDDDAGSHSVAHEKVSVVKLIRRRGATMGSIYRDCLEAASGRYLMLMNDDAVFRTQGWDISVTEAFSSFPDGIALVYGNDMDQGEKVPTFPIISREYTELAGGIVSLGYKNLHLESHLLDVFRQLKSLGHDRIIYLKDVVFEHRHFILGKAGPDKTYVKKDPQGDNRLFMELDEERAATARVLVRYIEDKAAGDGVAPEVSIIIYGEVSAGAGEFLRDRFSGPRLEVIRCPGPGEGAYSALDRCAAMARAPYILFMDGRAVPTNGFLTAVLDGARKTGAAVAGCKLVDRSNGRVVHAGAAFYKGEGGTIRYTMLFCGMDRGEPPVGRMRLLQAVSGVCMLVKKDAFIAAGGFARLPEGFEDIALCLRMTEAGEKVVYVPAEVFYSPERPLPRELPAGLAARADLDELLRSEAYSLVSTGIKPFRYRAEKM